MNWDAIGAIAELLGAIGVIASLVYLAGQIRDTRRALRASTYGDVYERVHEAVNSALHVPGLITVVRTGMEDYDRLNDEDAYQFHFWLTGVLHSFDNAFYQYRMGMLDDGRWEMHRNDCATVLMSPGVSEWWRSTVHRRSGFSPEFVALVEEILGEEAGAE
jgi:hypothetical protein